MNNRSVKDILMVLYDHLAKIPFFLLGGCLAAALFVLFFVKPVYTSSSTIYVYNEYTDLESRLTMGDISVSKSLVETYIVILKSDTLLAEVIERIPQYSLTTDDIRGMFSASAVNNTEVFQVRISSDNPVMSYDIANAIVDVAPTELIRVVRAGSVEVIDPPAMDSEAYYPIAQYTLAGGGLAVLLYAAFLIIRSLFDTVVHHKQDLTAAFTLPVLGEIPAVEKSPGGEKRKSDKDT